MTDSLLRRGQFSLAPAQRRDLAEALELCAANPVANVVPAAHVESALSTSVVPTGLWGMRRRRGDRSLEAVVWCGANFTAVIGPHDGDDLRAELATASVSRLPRPAAMVGEASVTLDVWGRVEPWWGPAREVRSRQASMAISSDPVSSRTTPEVQGIEPLRRGTLADYDQLLPAAVHMFIGEVGYDPLRHGRAAYEERLRALVRQGRSFVQFGEVHGHRQIVFKAEVGVVGGGVAQVQGVWVAPELRGRGLGTAGMAALVPLIRASLAPTVSLYVNDFNAPALGAYRSVGFRDVGTFATVMF